jgi:alkylated DNA repair dioxygenase AlkB
MQQQLLQESDSSYSLVGYYPNLIDSVLLQQIKDYCETTPDYRGGSTNFGTEVPRLQKWFQEGLGYFSSRWHKKYPRWTAFPYDKDLLEIQARVQSLTDQMLSQFNKFQTQTFNSCLLNYYRNHLDSIRAHSDDEPTFGRHPIVAVVSVGDTRTIKFARKVHGSGIKLDRNQSDLDFGINLEEGSLLLMAGSTQEYYIHEIPKQEMKCSGRHSLTFRRYYHL